MLKRVRQRDVADAAMLEKGDILQIAVQRRTIFHAHRQPDQARFHGFLSLLARFNHGKLLRRPTDQRFNPVNQAVCNGITVTLLLPILPACKLT